MAKTIEIKIIYGLQTVMLFNVTLSFKVTSTLFLLLQGIVDKYSSIY